MGDRLSRQERNLTKLGSICVASACLAGCGAELCEQRDVKYYDEALSAQLTKNGTPNTVRPEQKVCVAEKYAAQLDLAIRQVDKYFNEVADLLQDACQERAFAEWARREKLRFEIRDTLDADGSPSAKKMFLIRSFSPEEVTLNLQRLASDAPKGVACPKQKPQPPRKTAEPGLGGRLP